MGPVHQLPHLDIIKPTYFGLPVAVSNDVDVVPSTGKYSTGLCDVTAEFYEIPMTGGPFEVKYFADGIDVGRSWDFDIGDLIPIPGS